MPYKRFACKKMINETHLYVYLYNDCGDLDDLNGRPAFTHYRNGVVIDEQYYTNNFYTSDVNKPHNITYDKHGNIKCAYKQAKGQPDFSKINHTNISSVYFDVEGNITSQTYLNDIGSYKTNYFETD